MSPFWRLKFWYGFKISLENLYTHWLSRLEFWFLDFLENLYISWLSRLEFWFLDFLENLYIPWLRGAYNSVVMPFINHSISWGVMYDANNVLWHFKIFPRELSKYNNEKKIINCRSVGLAFNASLNGKCHLCSHLHTQHTHTECHIHSDRADRRIKALIWAMGHKYETGAPHYVIMCGGIEQNMVTKSLGVAAPV